MIFRPTLGVCSPCKSVPSSRDHRCWILSLPRPRGSCWWRQLSLVSQSKLVGKSLSFSRDKVFDHVVWRLHRQGGIPLPRKIAHLNLHRVNRDRARSNLVQLVLELYPTAAQISLVHISLFWFSPRGPAWLASRHNHVRKKEKIHSPKSELTIDRECFGQRNHSYAHHIKPSFCLTEYYRWSNCLHPHNYRAYQFWLCSFTRVTHGRSQP